MGEGQAAGVVVFPPGSIKAFQIHSKPLYFPISLYPRMPKNTTFLISKIFKKYLLSCKRIFIQF